jgi:hypothetical protein
MAESMGLDFEALANDSLAEKRSEYLAVVEQCAAARLNRVNLDAVNAPTAERVGLVLSCPNAGAGATRGISFPHPPGFSRREAYRCRTRGLWFLHVHWSRSSRPHHLPKCMYIQAVPTVSRQAFVKTSRLAEEYLVHEIIDKGGVGEVFKVVHKLDHVRKLFWSFRA